MPVCVDHSCNDRQPQTRSDTGRGSRQDSMPRFDTLGLHPQHFADQAILPIETLDCRCHGGQIGDTNDRWLYASRVMSWLVQAPLNLVEFVVDRFFALDVLAVQLFDQLAGRLLSVVVRVMAGAEQELAVGRLVGADAPAAALMAVELAR